MKKITLFILLFVAFASKSYGQFPAPYCAETFAGGVEPVTLVNFAGINNSTDPTIGTVNPAHEDFTSMIGNVFTGSTYGITLKGNTDGNFTTKLRVYIDWNQNNVFTDTGESYDIGTILNSTGQDAVQLTGTILVPTNASAGNTRMRVIKKYNAFSTQCNTAGYGQAEDYTLNVTIPSCSSPYGGLATVTSSSASLSWTSGGASNAEVLVQLAGLGLPSNTDNTGVNLSTSAYLATGLTPQTVYEFYVRDECSIGSIFSTWAGPFLFTTACGAITSLPWTENFDSLTAGINVFPICWAYENTLSTWSISTTPVAYSGANLLRRTWSTDGWAYTPLATLNIGTSYTLSYYMKTNDAVIGYDITVSVGNGQTVAAMTTTLSTVTGYQNPTWTKYSFEFTPITAGDYSFGVHIAAPNAPNGINFDDFKLEVTPSTAPTCATGILATINPTCGNFATQINWTTVVGANGYKLSIGTTSGGTDVMNNQIIGDVLTYSFIGNANTTYFYTVLPYNFVGNAVGCSEQSVTTFATGCYCDSLPTSRDGVGITNVQLGTIDFPNGDVSYFDNTATPVSLARGINTNLQISFDTGFGYTYNTNIWIDFNDNLTFESSELVYSGESLGDPTTVLNASFIMPALANLGSHRMRIGTADSGQLPTNPCYSGSYGVTLDYTVTIIDASCTPAAGVATLFPNCANNQFFVNVNVTALGSGTPSISNGTTTWPITSIGNVQVGPFANGTSSNSLAILHGSDSSCDLPLGTFSYSCPPSNEECTGAIALTPGGTFATYPQNGTILAATTTAGLIPSCQTSFSADVWYSVVIPASGSITIETQATATNTMTDSVVAVFSGTCGALTQVGCDDDLGTGAMSLLSLTGQTVGATLYVGVWKYATAAPTAANSGFQISAYDASLSTNSFNSVAFSYYPNPVKNTLNLSYSENILDVSVYNLLGQQVIF